MMVACDLRQRERRMGSCAWYLLVPTSHTVGTVGKHFLDVEVRNEELSAETRELAILSIPWW